MHIMTPLTIIDEVSSLFNWGKPLVLRHSNRVTRVGQINLIGMIPEKELTQGYMNKTCRYS